MATISTLNKFHHTWTTFLSVCLMTSFHLLSLLKEPVGWSSCHKYTFYQTEAALLSSQVLLLLLALEELQKTDFENALRRHTTNGKHWLQEAGRELEEHILLLVLITKLKCLCVDGRRVVSAEHEQVPHNKGLRLNQYDQCSCHLVQSSKTCQAPSHQSRQCKPSP